MYNLTKYSFKEHEVISLDICATRLGWFMMFNATFKNISVILWLSVLFVKETRVSRESNWPVVSHWQTLSHNVVSSTPRNERGSNSHWYWIVSNLKGWNLSCPLFYFQVEFNLGEVKSTKTKTAVNVRVVLRNINNKCQMQMKDFCRF
jgi:hypothetical protein